MSKDYTIIKVEDTAPLYHHYKGKNELSLIDVRKSTGILYYLIAFEKGDILEYKDKRITLNVNDWDFNYIYEHSLVLKEIISILKQENDNCISKYPRLNYIFTSYLRCFFSLDLTKIENNRIISLWENFYEYLDYTETSINNYICNARNNFLIRLLQDKNIELFNYFQPDISQESKPIQKQYALACGKCFSLTYLLKKYHLTKK